MKILAAVDGSAYTKRMLAYLAAHDEWLGPRHQYTLVHAVPALPPRAAAVLEKSLCDEYYRDEAEKVFKPIREFFSQRGMAAQFEARTGPADEAICKLATEGRHDLIVMGSHGHGSLAKLVLGSVANKVLAHTETPVLLIR